MNELLVHNLLVESINSTLPAVHTPIFSLPALSELYHRDRSSCISHLPQLLGKQLAFSLPSVT